MSLIVMPCASKYDFNLITKVFPITDYSSDISFISEADLLYLPGGGDVDPTRYDGDVTLCYGVNPNLDAWEDLAIQNAIKLNIPIFGLCRGSQTLWVALGGKLEEHIFPRHAECISRQTNRHHVEGLWGEIEVNSLHHQAAAGEAPAGVVVTSRARDGSIESFTYGNSVVGCQWHPELLTNQNWHVLLRATINKQPFTFEDIK